MFAHRWLPQKSSITAQVLLVAATQRGIAPSLNTPSPRFMLAIEEMYSAPA